MGAEVSPSDGLRLETTPTRLTRVTLGALPAVLRKRKAPAGGNRPGRAVQDRACRIGSDAARLGRFVLTIRHAAQERPRHCKGLPGSHIRRMGSCWGPESTPIQPAGITPGGAPRSVLGQSHLHGHPRTPMPFRRVEILGKRPARRPPIFTNIRGGSSRHHEFADRKRRWSAKALTIFIAFNRLRCECIEGHGCECIEGHGCP